MQGFDPEILNDFLTESGELLEELDADLVELESASDDPDLLNKVFRALHTIKGSASFLALAPIVSIAHAAEDALNAARRGELAIDREVMDRLLEAIDLLRTQFDELRDGSSLTEPDATLVETLRAMGEGGAPSASAPPTPSAPVADAPKAEPIADTGDSSQAEASGAGVRSLVLNESKSGLLEFMIADLDESLDDIEIRLARLLNGAESASEDAAHIGEVCEALTRTAEFFEHEPMRSLVAVLGTAAERVTDLADTGRVQLLPRMAGILLLLRKQAKALDEGEVVWWGVDTLAGRIADLILGHEIDADARLPEAADGLAALATDGVRLDGADEPAPADTPDNPPVAGAPAPPASTPDQARPTEPPVADAGPAKAARVEQTIRVEVGRLEELLNLVGELVLQKNRVGALARQSQDHDVLTQEAREALAQSSSDLDRVTGDIQLAVMRTRMQPLDKLFGKYPRLIRDLAKKTGKKIRLVVEGGDTEVDKSVIEELGDPLVHLMRNSADHGLETPEERLAAGKDETGTIRLVASQAGDHVLVQIIDDGRGLSREKLLAKAIEKGLTTEAEAEALSDRDVYRFIMGAGFSTAAQVSDLSGRGVGMDVVRTNIEKLKGSVDVDSSPGAGTTILIRIPLTVAIMPAMMVGVGRELYAVPLSNIVEIVRPDEGDVSSVNGRRVMRLRDVVLPLVSMEDLFDTPEAQREPARFAVVVELNEQRVGLLVSRLIGQHEVVIKPLDGGYAGSAPVSGATVRDDGGVSLIVDVAKVIAAAQESAEALAA